jgi:mono/diheme cytochrome c family protein
MFRAWRFVLILPLALAARADETRTDIEFNRDVRPILSRACFTCHGPDEASRKAGLRLDAREAALQPARSGEHAIVPGEPARSELIRRVTSDDPADVMPPPGAGHELSAAQKETLRRWIEQGAQYQRHWAYEPVRRPEVPALKDDFHRPRNPIDAFILKRLEEENLPPSPQASRETLIRRLSLDLIGLPPTPEEVDAFVSDTRPDAYERLVERLLASPHYGEHWARAWLDMARYADTNGYEKDERRSAWPWRDWVIRAFNADMPFDQFTLEQLAGDLLPNPTRDQLIATGFHRNTMTNTEGGTDDEEFRVAAVVDRVNTTFEVWLGSTFACAQCHTHKYDPFTQREYYEVFDIFNQTRDRGRTLDPILELPTPEQAARKEAILTKIAPLERQLNTQTPELDAALAAWSAKRSENPAADNGRWSVLAAAEASATDGVRLERQPDESWLSTGELPDNSDYTLQFTAPSKPLTALRLEALTDDRLPNGGPGRHEESDFTLTTFSAEFVTPEGESIPISFNLAYADFEMSGYGAARAIDKDANSGWAVAAFEPANRVSRHAVFVAEKPVEPPAGAVLKVHLRQQSSRAQHLLGRVRLAATDVPREDHAAWAALPAAVRQILAKPASERSDEEQKSLARHYRSIAPELEATRKAIRDLRNELPRNVPGTLVLEEVETRRETRIMLRGNFLNPGDPVSPGVPEILQPSSGPSPTNRLTFARWLTSPENPLTARVFVNRVWASYFGIGLVETSEDFGSQGEPPSHPQLLDWLAAEFMQPTAASATGVPAEPWSIKHLHRVIVLSATYRQASEVTPELFERDPYNRLLARGPRFRMSAEMLRDHALAVGGLLNRAIGGPSVMPYQPEGVWNNPYSSDKWEESSGGNQYRRGIYTFWRRTSPYASFAAFDAPSREVCAERRVRSNTPLQALVTLNDPAFMVAANALAREVLSKAGPTTRERLEYAFRRVLSRRPSPAETLRLEELLRESLASFESDSEAAAALTSGLDQPLLSLPVSEIAAWQIIANTLLNLDEALTKG